MAIFLDLAKAFDRGHHTEFIKILPNSGLKLFRKQKFIINGSLSEETIINYGVPHVTTEF